jgi:hypothetical protein
MSLGSIIYGSASYNNTYVRPVDTKNSEATDLLSMPHTPQFGQIYGMFMLFMAISAPVFGSPLKKGEA